MKYDWKLTANTIIDPSTLVSIKYEKSDLNFRIYIN